MDRKRDIIDKCLENEPAFCTSACPFGLDVPAFINKMQKVGWNAAFRIFHNAVGFPAIVSKLCDRPCEKACIRSGIDSSISVQELERAVLKFATRTSPNHYNLPVKKKTIAVVGGGISGLACALRLCGKKYPVTLFERSERLGGNLWSCLPPDLFLADIERQFEHENYPLIHQEVTDLAELKSRFDAVYVATGRGGDDFGLVQDPAGAFAAVGEGLFIGGELTGHMGCHAIADGLMAAQAIEWYLKVGRMDAPRRQIGTKLLMDRALIAQKPGVVPSPGSTYTEKEAESEADRCLKCSCDACVRHCELMKHAEKFPRKLADDVEATINPGTLAGDGTIATRIISSCTHCGMCRKVCPQDIDMGQFLLESHQAMTKKGRMPWAFHDFYLRDMDSADSDQAALTRMPPDQNRSGQNNGKKRDADFILFFPGCQLGASDPEYVIKAYEWLNRQGPSALMLRCCGVPAAWAGEEKKHRQALDTIHEQWKDMGRPQMVFACPTCRKQFQRYLPYIPGQMLYPMLLADFKEKEAEPTTILSPKTVSVFDPCASRGDSDLQKSIRDLVRSIKYPHSGGFSLAPLDNEGDMAQCCSFGGQINVANPRLAQQMVTDRIGQSSHDYVTYCSNCRDIFAGAGKRAAHILDLFFGRDMWDRRAPTITQRRANRFRLKQELLEMFWKEKESMGDSSMEENSTEESALKENSLKQINLKLISLKLIIPEQVKADLNRKMILETEMESVVDHCQRSGKKVFDPSSGLFTGHLKMGHTTFWARYREVGEGINELVSGYSHRMTIEED